MHKKLLCALALISLPLFLSATDSGSPLEAHEYADEDEKDSPMASASPVAAPSPKPKVYTLPRSILHFRAPDYIEAREVAPDGSSIWVYHSTHFPLTFRIIPEPFSTSCLVTHNETGKQLSISISHDCNLDWPKDTQERLGLMRVVKRK